MPDHTYPSIIMRNQLQYCICMNTKQQKADAVQFCTFLLDSTLHQKVSAALTNKRLMQGIKKASPLAQTSCLEGFHSVLNHFAPKMIAYCYVGQYCRYNYYTKIVFIQVAKIFFIQEEKR